MMVKMVLPMKEGGRKGGRKRGGREGGREGGKEEGGKVKKRREGSIFLTFME